MDRHRDPGGQLAAFAEVVLVRCPRCDRRAVVRRHGDDLPPWSETNWGQQVFTPRRLTCASCAHVASWPPPGEAPTASWGRAVDPWFGAPLWLRADVAGHELWAYGEAHLQVLRDYVAAPLRERGSAPPTAGDRWESATMLESLPRWMKAAAHRADLLRAIDALLADARS